MEYIQSSQTANTCIKGEAAQMERSSKESSILPHIYKTNQLNHSFSYMVEYLVYR